MGKRIPLCDIGRGMDWGVRMHVNRGKTGWNEHLLSKFEIY